MKLMVNGSNRLCGKLCTQGAKNSILPILSACVLCHGNVIIHNCPELSDVNSALKILSHLGIKYERQNSDVTLFCNGITRCDIPECLMREMRSSVVFLGAVLACGGCAEMSLPGGCELGPRPIDIHLSAMRKLGASIDDVNGVLDCKVNGRLVGTQISLWFPSVGATENIMLAAACAKGSTLITNAAREPEIKDLADFLTACGAKIYGAGGSNIRIDGVEKLGCCEYTVMPDRIVAVTMMSAAAMTNGDVFLSGARREDITAVCSLFEEAGCDITYEKDGIRTKNSGRLKPLSIVKTLPYPGFPTDAQAPVMAMTSIADGTTMFVETIFENRFRHVCELMRMGADIKTDGRVAVVNGVKKLHSAEVCCTDLRGGAAVLIAALSAEGRSTVSGIEHIDRGYQHIEKELASLGADIIRTD